MAGYEPAKIVRTLLRSLSGTIFAGRVGSSLLVLVAVLLFEGCDGTSHLPRPSLASCTPGWTPTALFLETARGPQAMVWSNGVLYQSRQNVPSIGTPTHLR